MRYLMTGLALIAAASLAIFVATGDSSSAAGPAAPVDFSGRWKLVEQETSASGGKGKLGNHEEPITIARSGDRLSIKVESSDAAGRYEYDMSGRTADGMTSRWEGSALVTRGKRLFTAPGGPERHAFEERRTLSSDGTRMKVETRIDLWFEDLRRTSVYARVQ